MSTFDFLTKRLDYLRRDALSILADLRAKVADAQPRHVAQQVRWYADDLMKASQQYDLVMMFVGVHETICLEAVEQEETFWRTDAAAWWAKQTRRLEAIIVSNCLRKIYRGIEGSSNPLTAIQDQMNIDAHKKVFEACFPNYYAFFDGEAVSDVLDGMEKREAAEEAERLKRPHKVVMLKIQGQKRWILETHNHKGTLLERRHLPVEVAGKVQARAAAEQWATDLRAERQGKGYDYITVEG